MTVKEALKRIDKALAVVKPGESELCDAIRVLCDALREPETEPECECEACTVHYPDEEVENAEGH
jgi:hypothetical protein